jgi:hypothetical protein
VKIFSFNFRFHFGRVFAYQIAESQPGTGEECGGEPYAPAKKLRKLLTMRKFNDDDGSNNSNCCFSIVVKRARTISPAKRGKTADDKQPAKFCDKRFSSD